jgi:hypothetical protein
VARGGEQDHVVHQLARAAPVPDGPARQYAALAVGDHVDLLVAASLRHPLDGVGHVLLRGLHVAERPLRQFHRAGGAALGREGEAIIPGPALVRAGGGAVHQEYRGLAEPFRRPIALHRTVQPVARDDELGPVLGGHGSGQHSGREQRDAEQRHGPPPEHGPGS